MGKRGVLCGHKVNLATQEDGFITCLNIEEGNPADCTLYLPALITCQEDYESFAETVVADGCYVSHANVDEARQLDVKPTVFKKVGCIERCGHGCEDEDVRVVEKPPRWSRG